MNHLEVKHLRMITTLAKTQNMTRAADKLCISQSALSQQLKDIENKLNASLFNRTRKKMIPTSIGKLILQTAQHVIETIEDTELEITKMVSGDQGELKVGMQCIFCYKWLPDVMGKFQNKFPNIELVIGNSNNIFKELDSGQFDLIITGAPLDDGHFIQCPLFADHMVCIMPNDHPLSAKPYVDFKDCKDASLITHSEKENNRFFELTFNRMGIEPRKYMTVTQPQAIIEMVSSGFGISFFPKWAVQSAINSNVLTARPVTRTGIPIQWNATFLKKKQMLNFQMEFINMVSKLNPVESAKRV